jgi:hypothetical protein
MLLLAVPLFLLSAFLQSAQAAAPARPERSAAKGKAALSAQKKTGPTSHRRADDPATSPLAEYRHGIEESTARYALSVEYPSFGAPDVDASIALWARRQVDTFIRGLEAIPAGDPSHFALTIAYQYLQPSVHSTTVLFFIDTDTGGPLPDRGMATFTYDMRTGNILEFDDIFADSKSLLPFLSTFSQRALSRLPWAREHMGRIQAGTSPDALNFTFFAVTSQGLSLYFPPGQAGPISEGTLAVAVPLEILRPFQPSPLLWGNATHSLRTVTQP